MLGLASQELIVLTEKLVQNAVNPLAAYGNLELNSSFLNSEANVSEGVAPSAPSIPPGFEVNNLPAFCFTTPEFAYFRLYCAQKVRVADKMDIPMQEADEELDRAIAMSLEEPQPSTSNKQDVLREFKHLGQVGCELYSSALKFLSTPLKQLSTLCATSLYGGAGKDEMPVASHQMSDGSFIVRRYVDSDNSCLFTAVGYVMDHNRYKGLDLRSVIAQAVAAGMDWSIFAFFTSQSTLALGCFSCEWN